MRKTFGEGAKNLLMSVVFVLVVIAGCGGLLYMNSQGRTPTSEVEKAEQALATAQGDLAAIKSLPVMPLLFDNWSKANLVFSQFEVKVDTEGKLSDQAGTEIRYAGGATNWTGVITGAPKTVLAALWELRELVPMTVNGVSMSGADKDDAGSKPTMQVSVSVLGRY